MALLFAVSRKKVYCVRPCPCGYYGDSQKPCLRRSCRLYDEISKTNIEPLLDRIDIHIEVPRVDYEKLSGDRVENLPHPFASASEAAKYSWQNSAADRNRHYLQQ
ncbi:MAG: ATP-binding protein [Anaerolineales bacterium]